MTIYLICLNIFINKLKLIYILLLFPLFYLAACNTVPRRDYKFIENPQIFNRDPLKELSTQEVQFDLSQVIYALNTAYSGKFFLPKGEFQNLIQGLSNIRGPLTTLEFCEQIDRQMDSVSDNHLNAKFDNKPCFKSPNNRDGQVGKNFYTMKQEIPWYVKLDKKDHKTALLISITGFPKSSNPVWNGFIEEAKSKLPKCDLVILDLRGNGGGDDSKGYQLSSLLAGEDLKTPYDKQWTNPSPEAQQLFVNTFEYWEFDTQKEGKIVQPYIIDLKRKYSDNRDKALKDKNWLEENAVNSEGSDFTFEKSIQKPIYILMDADCASSCESTIDFFEYNKLVKTVGENTAGFVHFGNNGSVFLKNSGIRLQIAISYDSYIDRRFIEKTGIKPRIQVSPGKNALDYAWKDFFDSKLQFHEKGSKQRKINYRLKL